MNEESWPLLLRIVSLPQFVRLFWLLDLDDFSPVDLVPLVEDLDLVAHSDHDVGCQVLLGVKVTSTTWPFATLAKVPAALGGSAKRLLWSSLGFGPLLLAFGSGGIG